MSEGIISKSSWVIVILLFKKIIRVVIFLVISDMFLEFIVNIISMVNCMVWLKGKFKDKIMVIDIKVVVMLLVSEEK